jgi:hypothetical protein
MTTIDQRILIPAPPAIVWEYMSSIDNNPNWQANCENVTFLSQRRAGVGTRWRETLSNKQEYVYEISTWYDTLGYEYVFVDGPTFQSCKGRLRLQEIPEGTIVQWSYIYEIAGVLSGLRNALTTQRRIESEMVESLKNLWKIVRRTGSLEGYEARSLMRDGPQSPQERLQYQSRYTGSKSAPEGEITDLYTKLKNEEPPISTEDTRPGKAAEQQAEPATAEADVPIDDADKRFAPPKQAETRSTVTFESLSSLPSEQHQQEDASPYAPMPTQEQKDETLPTLSSLDSLLADNTPAMPEPLVEDEPAVSVPPPMPEVMPQEPAETTSTTDLTPQVPDGRSTSEMSIWEVFGIPSPTDSQRMRAIQVSEEAEREYAAEQQEPEPIQVEEHPVEATTIEAEPIQVEQPVGPTAAIETEPIQEDVQETVYITPPTNTEDDMANTGGRTGLRISARRKMIHIRRPGQ